MSRSPSAARAEPNRPYIEKPISDWSGSEEKMPGFFCRYKTTWTNDMTLLYYSSISCRWIWHQCTMCSDLSPFLQLLHHSVHEERSSNQHVIHTAHRWGYRHLYQKVLESYTCWLLIFSPIIVDISHCHTVSKVWRHLQEDKFSLSKL